MHHQLHPSRVIHDPYEFALRCSGAGAMEVKTEDGDRVYATKVQILRSLPWMPS